MIRARVNARSSGASFDRMGQAVLSSVAAGRDGLLIRATRRFIELNRVSDANRKRILGDDLGGGATDGRGVNGEILMRHLFTPPVCSLISSFRYSQFLHATFLCNVRCFE